jgi:hypothetical protein
VLLGTTVEKLFVRSSLVRIWYFSCQWLRVIINKGKEGGGRKHELEAKRKRKGNQRWGGGREEM